MPHAPLRTPRSARSAPTHARADEIAERLAGDMSAAWEGGLRPAAEEFLARSPEVRRSPEAAARVIYEEVCLRENLGQADAWAAVAGRFPQWADALALLRECHELVGVDPAPSPAPPPSLEPGSTLGGFRIHSPLGRGQRGGVYLAAETSLADRPVVLKITHYAAACREHLTLARLQHPHVVPLYAVHDFPDRALRALCMPYLGGATLDRVLHELRDIPPVHRTGADLLRVLDAARTPLIDFPTWGGARTFLAGTTYPRALCWVAACLAEALHVAHTRGLLHLDLKPSNILLADDGRPMLLDFHLAQGPLHPDDARPERLGGTFGYMAPEQEAAMDACFRGRSVPVAVDGRADVYALGATLFEALVGVLPTEAEATAARLLWSNPKAGRGLAEVVVRCLAPRPEARYHGMAPLAAALRRQLGSPARPGVAAGLLAPLRALRLPWRRDDRPPTPFAAFQG